MNHLTFGQRYKKIWETFAGEISQLSVDLIKSSDLTDSTLHELLSSLQSVPYYEAPAFFMGLTGKEKTGERNNIGSVTGLFFEIIVASIIKGYITKRLPDAKVELNSCSNMNVASIARDPDIFVHLNERYIVFEAKVSPKQIDLNRAIYLHERYTSHSDITIDYFLIGGHISANADIIQKTQGWACFTSSSDRNKKLLTLFKLDELLEKAVIFLCPAEHTSSFYVPNLD